MFEFKPVPSLAERLAKGPREALFSVGKKKVYTIPVEFPATMGLAYGNMKLYKGDEQAVVWAVQLALGSDGFDALTQADPSREELAQVFAVIVRRIQGYPIAIPGKAPAPEEEPSPAESEAVLGTDGSSN